MKGVILPFHKKGNVRITKNSRNTIIIIAAKVYNTLLLKCIQKSRKWLSKEFLHNLKESDTPSNHQRSTDKNLRATLLFADFFKAFNSIYRKDRANTIVYGLSKETVTA